LILKAMPACRQAGAEEYELKHFLTSYLFFGRMCSMSEQTNNKDNIFKSEKTLWVLKEVEVNPQITQRVLAQKLEISLGKINFLINALVDKGIIEIKNFKNSKRKLAYIYLLTPKGIKTKLQLTQKFFLWKLAEFERLKQEIESFKKEVPQENLQDLKALESQDV